MTYNFKTQPSTTGAVLGCFTFLILMVVGPILNGLALSILWGWFVAAQFGLPLLGKAAAVGLGLTGKAFLGLSSNESKKEEVQSLSEAVSKCIGSVVGVPLGLLILGYITKLFL